MSGENVEAFRRALEAFNRRDVDALCEALDKNVRWHPALTGSLGGERAVYRGHQGIRELIRQEDEALSRYHVTVVEIRDLGDQVVGIGSVRAEGRESGIAFDSPWAVLIEGKDGKASRVRTFLDPAEALKAAGVDE
jgi:ketosteroid isomerase-like protein